MSRRAIREMLMGPKKRTLDRPWVLPVSMAAILALGVGLGIGIGLLAGRRTPPPSAGQAVVAQAAPVVPAEVAPPVASLPSRRAEGGRDEDGPLVAPPSVVPVVPPPAARPEAGPIPAPTGAAPSAAEPAALIAPQPPVARGGMQPAWLRYAVPSPRVAGRPMIAVVIDDLGLDRKRTERVSNLHGPLTLSFMTYAHDLDQQTALARAHGHELMVHMPMQPMNASYDAGPEVLNVGLSADELRRRIEWGLSRFPGFVGVNNHMGSRFTANPAGMAVVMQELSRHGLMFLDSVTTGKTVAAEAARAAGVPFASRQVFLDNTQSVASVRAQLEQVEEIARRHGAAIAIGHPHDATIAALSAWLPTLAAHGFVLVPVTTIVQDSGRRHQG